MPVVGNVGTWDPVLYPWATLTRARPRPYHTRDSMREPDCLRCQPLQNRQKPWQILAKQRVPYHLRVKAKSKSTGKCCLPCCRCCRGSRGAATHDKVLDRLRRWFAYYNAAGNISASEMGRSAAQVESIKRVRRACRRRLRQDLDPFAPCLGDEPSDQGATPGPGGKGRQSPT